MKLFDSVLEILTKSFTFVVVGWEHPHLIDFFGGWKFYFPSPDRAGCTFHDLTSHLKDFIPDVALGEGVRRDSQFRRDWINLEMALPARARRVEIVADAR